MRAPHPKSQTLLRFRDSELRALGLGLRGRDLGYRDLGLRVQDLRIQVDLGI